MPIAIPKDCVARMDEFACELARLSDSMKCDASISGAALSNPSLLLIKYISPEHLTKLWRLPSHPPDIEKAFPDLDDYIDDYLEEFDDKPTQDILAWKAHFRSCDVYQAIEASIQRGLLHHPDRNWDEPLPYVVLNGTSFDSSYMYWHCRLVLVTPDMPNLTVMSVHPQQGLRTNSRLPSSGVLSTGLYASMIASKIPPRYPGAQIRLISICDTQARIVSANFSREYLRFAMKRVAPREDRRVCCDVSVEDYQDLRDKENFLYLMGRISELPVKDNPDS